MATPGQNNMHNLTTLIKRLEAATSRLEDIATSVDTTGPNGMAAVSQTSVAASESTMRSETPTAGVATPPEPLPRQIEDYDKIIDEEITSFVDHASKIGGIVEEQAQAVLSAFKAERTYLLVATKAKEPKPVPPELMTELHQYTSTVDEIKETNRRSPFFFHLNAVSDGLMALHWIVHPKPTDMIDAGLDGAKYHGNKVTKEYKDKDPSHVEYIKAYYNIFPALRTYVKEHYLGGLTWNQKDGIDAVEALKQIQAGSAGPTPRASIAMGGPPPPPPPPLPSLDQLNGLTTQSKSTSAKGGDMGAVFDQLNQGSSVTSGLRKVEKSEMTHKNPSLRTANTVPERSSSQTSAGRGKSPLPARKPDNLKAKKPSRKELDGSKWIVENFENTGNDIIEIPAERNHSILISKCSKCIIKVTGKANAISIDNCSGLSILIESLVSSLDVIKSPKFAVQIDGTLPTIMFDQIDGAQVYLSEGSMKSPPEIFTSKSSAINVVLPPVGDADSKEEALPEQLRSYYKNGKFVTEVVEHAG